jgi:hypothetical protein
VLLPQPVACDEVSPSHPTCLRTAVLAAAHRDHGHGERRASGLEAKFLRYSLRCMSLSLAAAATGFWVHLSPPATKLGDGKDPNRKPAVHRMLGSDAPF